MGSPYPLKKKKTARPSDSPSNKCHGYQITRFDVLLSVEYSCDPQLPYHKTQYEDILLGYDGGFDLNTGPPNNPKSYDNPIPWQQNEVYESQSPSITAEVQNKKNEFATDGNATQYIDLITSSRFRTSDIPAHFLSKADCTVNYIYNIMTTAEISTLTQLCKLERTQILTILSFAQTKHYIDGYLITGNRSNFVHFEGASLGLYVCHHHLLPLYTHKEKSF